MPQKDLVQIGLRLDAAVLEKLDKHAASLGMDRTSVIRLSIVRFMEGSEPALVSPGASGVDQPARDALVALKDRIDELEIRLENKIANAIGTAKAAHEIATDAHTAQTEAAKTKSNIDDVFSQAFSNS